MLAVDVERRNIDAVAPVHADDGTGGISRELDEIHPGGWQRNFFGQPFPDFRKVVKIDEQLARWIIGIHANYSTSFTYQLKF